MDFIKKAKDTMGGSSSHQQQPTEGGQPAQKEDYVDKAFSGISKKAGMNTSQAQNEKITDAGRGLYEKQTGSKVNPKVCLL